MENNSETPNEKKSISKAKSCNNGPPMQIKNEPTKRKSFSLNEAVKSLDLALGRLKKSKLVNGEYSTSTASSSPLRRGDTSSELFMDLSSSSNINPGMDNASLMSMNFSHYELMRNLSRSNSTSDVPISGSTCNQADTSVKDEHLEKYFRSVEMWFRNCRSPNSVHFEIPEK